MAYVISDDCIACGTCIDECPSEAISEGDKYSINPDLCVDCGTCAGVCPSEAIHPENNSDGKNNKERVPKRTLSFYSFFHSLVREKNLPN